MPALDGTGPIGTGRGLGLGPCRGGMARGRGFGRGNGRGMGPGRGLALCRFPGRRPSLTERREALQAQIDRIDRLLRTE